jgi:hypothetical protein
MFFAQRPGHEGALGGDLRARVPGTDDDEGQPRRPLVGVVGVVGQLDLPRDVVAQV